MIGTKAQSPRAPGGGGGTPLFGLYGPIRGRAAGHCVIFGLSALNSVYNFRRICPLRRSECILNKESCKIVVVKYIFCPKQGPKNRKWRVMSYSG